MLHQGILLLDKEAGVTSRRIDNILQKRFQTKKVGHLGTLDPFATGLLIVAVGKATKCLPYLESDYKTYQATLKLGEKTSTGDPEGEVVMVKAPSCHEKEEIQSCLDSFLGFSEQLPPMTSAIKIEGVPLYKKARKGLEVERKKRKIEVKSIRLLSLEGDIVRFEATVSAGTYMRSLGEDIAEKLGEIGHLTELRRTEVGSLSVSLAKKLGEISEEDFLSPGPVLNMRKIQVQGKQKEDALNGKPLRLQGIEDPLVALLDGEEALAVYSYSEEKQAYTCLRGLF